MAVIVLTASRTALIAVGVIAIFAVLRAIAIPFRARSAAIVVLAGVGASLIALPLVVTDPDAFSTRAAKWQAAFTAAGYPAKADMSKVNVPMVIFLLFILALYVTIVYAPIAAWLVELFPARIRYTSMSLPYHIGNGWFGGMLPLLATAMVAASGNIYYGLWYPIVVALMTAVIGFLFLAWGSRDGSSTPGKTRRERGKVCRMENRSRSNLTKGFSKNAT